MNVCADVLIKQDLNDATYDCTKNKCLSFGQFVFFIHFRRIALRWRQQLCTVYMYVCVSKRQKDF